MGNITSHNYKYINYREINDNSAVLINTLPDNSQQCLIKNTVPADQEVKIVELLIENRKYDKKIIIYGKNSYDKTVEKKAGQFMSLGFTNVYIYSGGLFEWLLIQDIYGADNFPTTSKERDILKYA